MRALYLTLSLRYLRRRWFWAVLIVASIALGLAMLAATQALHQTMVKAARGAGHRPAFVGAELAGALGRGLGSFRVRAGGRDQAVTGGGTVQAKGVAAALGGN